MNIYKPTGSYLRERFEYSDGRLIWKHRKNVRKEWNTCYAGKEAGTCQRSGYYNQLVRIIMIDNTRYREHHLIWVYHYDYWPQKEIDHIDRDPTNNRIENLREATSGENKQNKALQSNNKSGYPGVSWHKKANKWRSRIYINRKEIHLGLFEDYSDACKAYDEAKLKYHVFSPVF